MEGLSFDEKYDCNDGTLKKAKCSGLTFHLKPRCPVCDSCYSDLYCSACVEAGKYTSTKYQDGQISFAGICDQLALNQGRISRLSFEICQLMNNGTPFMSRDEASLAKSEVELMGQTIQRMSSVNLEKKREVANLRSSIRSCRGETQKTRLKLTKLQEHMKTVIDITASKTAIFSRISTKLSKFRQELAQELFSKFLPVTIADSPTEFDRIAGLPLNVDTQPFSVPEPTISSHAALTYMIVALRTLAQIFNIWTPLDTRRLLQLNAINSDSPLRDNIAYVYRMVSRAIQLLCAVCCCTGVISDQSAPLLNQCRPLVGLYFLSEAVQHSLNNLRSFDEPYCLSQSNIFAALVLDTVAYPCSPSNQLSPPRVPVHRRCSSDQQVEGQKYFGVGDDDHDDNDGHLDWDVVSLDSFDE